MARDAGSFFSPQNPTGCGWFGSLQPLPHSALRNTDDSREWRLSTCQIDGFGKRLGRGDFNWHDHKL